MRDGWGDMAVWLGGLKKIIFMMLLSSPTTEEALSCTMPLGPVLALHFPVAMPGCVFLVGAGKRQLGAQAWWRWLLWACQWFSVRCLKSAQMA
jgi:hypothetical protein